MLNVKKLLTKLLTSKVSYEFVSNVGSSIFNSSWTATDDGIIAMKLGSNTSGATAYWYVQDSTAGQIVAYISMTANGTSNSTSFPVIKGHSYTTNASSAVDTADANFYKLKWGVLLKGIIRNILTPCRKVVGVC